MTDQEAKPTLKIAVISSDIVPGDKAANLEALNKTVDALEPGVDLIVVPELFTTGFTSDRVKLHRLAEDNDGDTMRIVKLLSQKTDAAIAGSFLGRTADEVYNRGFIVTPDGDAKFYNKHHLFSMSSESRCLTAGCDNPAIVPLRGWNLGLVVCYDIRFPVWCRNVDNAYDLLIVPANWPQSREYAWNTLLRARAIENQAYVVGANRSGVDKFGDYNGLSIVVDFQGNDLSVAGADPQVIYAVVERRRLEHLRTDFPVWRDADRFQVDIGSECKQ